VKAPAVVETPTLRNREGWVALCRWSGSTVHFITRSAYSGCLLMYSRTNGQMTSTL
jgi:hypothetical protein